MDRRQEQRNRHGVKVGRRRAPAGRQWIAADFLDKVNQHRIAGCLNLLAQPGREVPAPFGQIYDPRRQAGGMQIETDDIHRWPQQQLIDTGDQPGDGLVGSCHRPVPIDRQGRVRIMHRQNVVDTLTRQMEAGVVQRTFPVDRSKSGGAQHCVSVAQRDRQKLRQMQQNLATGHGPPGFKAIQMPGRYFGVEGKG